MPSTTHTSAGDWRAAADIIGQASLAETVEEIGDVALGPLQALFGSEFTTFDLYDRQGRMVYFRHQPAVDLSHLLEPFHAHFHEHPVLRHWGDYARGSLLMHLSEHMPVRRFLRSGLFNEVYRHQRIKYQIGFAGAVDACTTWSLATGRLTHDYGSREKELAHFLRPQLSRLISRAGRREFARQAGDALAAFFSAPLAAYALVAADGRLLELSAAARRLFEREIPGSLPDPDRIPPGCTELLAALLRTGPRRAPAFTVVSAGPLRALVFHPPGLGPALVLFQEPARPAPKPGLRLTRREAEILAWLGEGKTNPEIALLLGVSPRTVDKHCQNLFAKLGVESRLGAALLGRPQSLN